MTPELRWLLYTALFAGSLWMPYIIGINVTDFEGKKDVFLRPPDPSKMKPWVHRSLRAHLNLLEQLLPFGLVVIVGALVHVSTPVTRLCPMIFFFLRLVHAIGFISGLARAPIRPLLYLAGWCLMLVDGWQVLAHADAG
jgi:uncharacterized MAPEG superfamily protein